MTPSLLTFGPHGGLRRLSGATASSRLHRSPAPVDRSLVHQFTAVVTSTPAPDHLSAHRPGLVGRRSGSVVRSVANGLSAHSYDSSGTRLRPRSDRASVSGMAIEVPRGWERHGAFTTGTIRARQARLVAIAETAAGLGLRGLLERGPHGRVGRRRPAGCVAPAPVPRVADESTHVARRERRHP
jgi:hypothetical protein